MDAGSAGFRHEGEGRERPIRPGAIRRLSTFVVALVVLLVAAGVARSAPGDVPGPAAAEAPAAPLATEGPAGPPSSPPGHDGRAGDDGAPAAEPAESAAPDQEVEAAEAGPVGSLSVVGETDDVDGSRGRGSATGQVDAADPAQTTAAEARDPEGPPGNANAIGSGNGPSDRALEAPGQADAGQDRGNDPDPDDAHAGGQDGSDATGGAASTPGPEAATDDPVPAAETSTSGRVDQLAEADADVIQRGASVTRVAARLESPGDGPAVVQRNAAAAVASAAATAPAVDADPPAPTAGGRDSRAAEAAHTQAVAREARAAAHAAQTGAANVALSIRVGSPGDDGPISQLNEVEATATATTASPPGASETTAATADASQDDASNLRVSVRVGSPGDEGDLEQRNSVTARAAATAAGDGGSATAIAAQRDARNTSVQIRVASPGDPGTVSQRSTATESLETSAPAASSATSSTTTTSGTAGRRPAVSVRRGGADTALVVDLDGFSLPLPFLSAANARQPEWRWDWAWDGTPVVDEPTTWQWTWTAATPANAPTRAAAVGAVAGALVWSWTWLEGGEETVAWTRQIDLDCDTCAWVWDWRWTTSAPPTADATADETAPEGAATPAGPVIVQEIVAEATAIGTARGSVDQAVAQTAAEGPAFAGQIGWLQQSARAEAQVAQEGVELTWTSSPGTVTQELVAAAQAEATVDGSIEQHLTQEAGGEAWAGQQAEVVQIAAAAAATRQATIAVDEQTVVEALATAAATATADVGQSLDQEGAGTGARWAGQLTRIGQDARARTSVAQSGADPLPSRTAAAQAVSTAVALVVQTAAQLAETGATGTQTSRQSVMALQSAVADAVTTDGVDTHAIASSAAVASARALAEQVALQLLVDATEQDGTQEATFLQDATSHSNANGGIGGLASVVSCATVQQTATQASGGAPVTASEWDATVFCTPPPTAPAAPPAAAATVTFEATIRASGPGTVVSVVAHAILLRAPSLPRRPAGTTSAPVSAAISREDAPAPAPLFPPSPGAPAPEVTATGHAEAPPASRSAATPGGARAAAATGVAAPPPAKPTERRTAPSGDAPSSPEEAPGIPGSASAAGPGGGAAAALSPLPVGVAPPSGWSVQVESAVRRPTSPNGRLETPG